MLKIKENAKNLVISAVSDASLHRHWLHRKSNFFDLYLIYYGDDKNFKYPYASLIKHQKGSKYNLFADIIEEHPEILSYDHIWMPDDDMYLNEREIFLLFNMAKKYNLSICQPSIMGWYGVKTVVHQPECILRYTNYIEIMCPCFSSSALKTCLPTFRENKTGWGIDHVWAKLLEYPTDKMAIIDDIIAIHTRPVGKGDMYKNQGGKMELAWRDLNAVSKKYNMGEDLHTGKILAHLEKFNDIVEFGRIRKDLGQGERIWPNSSATKMLCDTIRER